MPIYGRERQFKQFFVSNSVKYNIVEWNHFHSICGHEIHILSKFHLFICKNVHLKPEKPKIANISIRKTRKSDFTKNSKAFSFFIRFGSNFQDTLESVFRA